MIQQEKGEKLNYDRKIYDFMQWNVAALTLFSTLFIASIIIIFFFGFNYGLDFTGGVIFEISLEKIVNLDKIRNAFDNLGLLGVSVQNFGSDENIMVRMQVSHNSLGQDLYDRVIEILNEVTEQDVFVKRFEFIGPSIGSELTRNGISALLISLFCILIYIGFRFEWRLAIGSIAALLHDVIISLGAISLFHIEIDVESIAALIFVVGYSLNDSVVLSDRIRENFFKIYDVNTFDIFNISITQTLNRTLMTTATTMIVILMLLIFGGITLHSFSIILLVGVFIGTVSSIFLLLPLALRLGIKREHLIRKI